MKKRILVILFYFLVLHFISAEGIDETFGKSNKKVNQNSSNIIKIQKEMNSLNAEKEGIQKKYDLLLAEYNSVKNNKYTEEDIKNYISQIKNMQREYDDLLDNFNKVKDKKYSETEMTYIKEEVINQIESEYNKKYKEVISLEKERLSDIYKIKPKREMLIIYSVTIIIIFFIVLIIFIIVIMSEYYKKKYLKEKNNILLVENSNKNKNLLISLAKKIGKIKADKIINFKEFLDEKKESIKKVTDGMDSKIKNCDSNKGRNNTEYIEALNIHLRELMNICIELKLYKYICTSSKKEINSILEECKSSLKHQYDAINSKHTGNERNDMAVENILKIITQDISDIEKWS